MDKIVIIGGRGNGTVIASTIEDCKKMGQNIDVAGFLNDNEKNINQYPVLGPINKDAWRSLFGYSFIFAMSNVKQAYDRHCMLKDLEIPTERFTSIIHPTSVVSSSAKIGRGVVLMPFTVVSPGVIVGNHSQMYAQSFIGHDTTIREMVFIANNASIGGRVNIDDGAHIGSNSSIIERVELERYSIVGIGSVVTKNVDKGQIVVGNPAKPINSQRFN